MAVQRRFKNEQGEYESDFINCIAWGKTAEFVSMYFKKGNKIAIVGRLQTRNYDDKDGKKVYVTEVVAEEVYFVESNIKGANTVTVPKNDLNKEDGINFEDLKNENFNIEVDTEEEYLEFRE